MFLNTPPFLLSCSFFLSLYYFLFFLYQKRIVPFIASFFPPSLPMVPFFSCFFFSPIHSFFLYILYSLPNLFLLISPFCVFYLILLFCFISSLSFIHFLSSPTHTLLMLLWYFSLAWKQHWFSSFICDARSSLEYIVSYNCSPPSPPSILCFHSSL